MRLVVEFTQDCQYNDYKKGDTGFVDGYVQGSDNRPYAVICLYTKDKMVMAPTYSFKPTRMLVLDGGLLMIKPL